MITCECYLLSAPATRSPYSFFVYRWREDIWTLAQPPLSTHLATLSANSSKPPVFSDSEAVMPAAMVYLAMASESSIVLKLDSSDGVLRLFCQLEINKRPSFPTRWLYLTEHRPLIYLPPAGIARQVDSIRLLVREKCPTLFESIIGARR